MNESIDTMGERRWFCTEVFMNSTINYKFPRCYFSCCYVLNQWCIFFISFSLNDDDMMALSTNHHFTKCLRPLTVHPLVFFSTFYPMEWYNVWLPMHNFSLFFFPLRIMRVIDVVQELNPTTLDWTMMPTL